MALLPISKTKKKNQSVKLDAMWCYSGCDGTKARSRSSHKPKDDGEEEPCLVRWKKVYKAPTGMVEQECQGFLQPEPGWCELQK